MQLNPTSFHRMIGVHRRAPVVSLLCLLAIAAAKPDLISLARKGESLTDDQAKALQADLQKHPDDANSHAQLLGYQLSRHTNFHQLRLANILWMIDHQTTDAITGSAYCQIDPTDDADGYAKAKADWDAQVAAHQTDAEILTNAASFFTANDFGAADSLLQQTIALDPKNGSRPEHLAQLYEKRFTQHPDETARLAPLALLLRESAYKLILDPPHRFALLVQMPMDALRGDDRIAAKKFAGQLVATAPKFKTDPAFGDAVHWGNIVLGELALRNEKTDDAVAYLNAAAQTPGSATIAGTGPDFHLAKGVLAKGERSAVHDYLTACKKFWPAGREKLNSWLTIVDAGGTPDM
jgi:hypothetical protein